MTNQTTSFGDLTRRSFVISTAAAAVIGTSIGGANADTVGGIEARAAGTEEPTLIFVHGFACSLEDWDQQVAALSPRFRCVALDLPGHGRSARPETASVAVMASAVNKVKERFAVKKAILVGHSMGCRVVTEAYQQSPADVVGIVYVDGSLLEGDPETAVKRAKELIDKSGVDGFTQFLFKDMFLEGSDPKLRERLMARAVSVDPKVREEISLDTVRYDATKNKAALANIKVPVLVLQATYRDAQFRRQEMKPGLTTNWMDAVAAAVPTSQAKIIQGSGHFAMRDAATSVNDAIGQFADSTKR